MKKSLNICCLIIVLLGSLCVNADNQVRRIKLAILDNPSLIEKYNSKPETFQEAYMRGINTAIADAKRNGYSIEYKTFFFGNNLLDILNKVSEVNAWKPDVIIGLHSSNQFLIARNYFEDTQVISLYATDKNIKYLPDNFYSLGVLDQNAIDPIIKFIAEHFNKKNIFLAIEADSKESVDLADLLKVEINKAFPEITTSENRFLSDEIKTLDMKEFMTPYKKENIIIVLADNYYQVAELMSKIHLYMAPDNPVIIATVDNWGNEKVPTENILPYVGYRITTYTTRPNTKIYKEFHEAYLRVNHEEPINIVSYTTYNAVASFIQALKQFPVNDNYPVRKKIVLSYQKALSRYPFWYKPDRAYIYLMTPGKEQLLNYSYPLTMINKK